MKYAINSSDTNDVYSFFIPIVSLLWRERGYNPVALLVGDRNTWNSSRKSKCVLDYAEKAQIKVIFVKQVPGYKSSTISQLSRLFACAEPCFNPSDYIIISDADMLPLSRTWFNQYDAGKSFNFFGGNAYLGYIGDASPTNLPRRLPICYIGANVGNWRQVMGVKDLSLQLSMEQVIKEREASGCKDDWFYDENTFVSKMYRSPLVSQSQFINRDWTHGRASQRLDRDVWHFTGQKDMIDSHFLRPGYKYLDTLWKLLEVYAYQGHISWIKEYAKAFVSS